jgi:2-phosphoglycerate kinase
MAAAMRHDTDRIIAAADRESRVVWTAVEAFVRASLAAGHDVLVEGVAVLPPLIAGLNLPYQAIFLGNQSPDHHQIILDYARTHPESWLGGLRADTVDAFATFTAAYSAYSQRQAAQYGFKNLEMGDGIYQDRLRDAVTGLRAPHTA